MVFPNKFLDDKPEGYLIDDIDIEDSDDIHIDNSDDIDDDLDTKLQTMMNVLTMYMTPKRPIGYHPSIRISKNNVSLHNMDSKHS